MTSRILVADDSTTIQKIVSMAFEVEDVEVEGIGNGQEAFDRIPEFKPDIVLADVDMPGLNGFELSAKIKESPDTSATKVLLLASDFEDFDEGQYKSCRADNHISKPFKSDDIVAMVKSLLEGGGESPQPVDSESAEESLETGEIELTLEPLEKLGEADSEEEPSLEELLASVEKLSTDGMDTEDLEEPPITEDDTKSSDAEVIEPVEELDAPIEISAEVSEPLESIELIAEEEILGLPQDESMEAMELSESLQDISNVEGDSSGVDDDIMDQMIRGVEELKESVESAAPGGGDFSFAEENNSDEMQEVADPLGYDEEQEIFAEVRPRNLDNMDDLDSTFKEIVRGGRGAPVFKKEMEPTTELSSLGGIVPEPEDLLERIAPGAFSEVGKRPATPEDIQDSLDTMSRFSDQPLDMGATNQNYGKENWNSESSNDPFTQAIADEVRQLLQKSLGTSLEKEVSGLSEVILKTIREVVREITPEIARGVIREEIEKIKKQDRY